MLPTPSTSHVSYSSVYEPAEDSFLLLDSLSSASEVSWLQQRFPVDAIPSPVVAEIGVGSGVVIAFMVAHAEFIFGRQDILAMGFDVSVNACAATHETVSEAQLEQGSSAVYLGSFCANLTSSISDASIDLLIFNPPYVPTPELPALPDCRLRENGDFEADSHLLSLSYAGGIDGMETTYRLLEALPAVLSSRGVAYVLLCAQNKPDVVKAFVKSALAMQVETVRSSGKAAGWEKLEILRIWR